MVFQYAFPVLVKHEKKRREVNPLSSLFHFLNHFFHIPEEEIQECEDETLGHVEYWIDADGQFYIMNTYSEIIEKALLVLEIQAEERLLTAKANGAVSAAIFILKSKFGWRDKPDNNVLVCNNIHVATRKEAENCVRYLTLEEVEVERNITTYREKKPDQTDQ